MSTGKETATTANPEIAKTARTVSVVTPAVDIFENDQEILVQAENAGRAQRGHHDQH